MVGCVAKCWAGQLEKRMEQSWEQRLGGWRVAMKVGSMAQTTVATWVAWTAWPLVVTKDNEKAVNSAEWLAQQLARKRVVSTAAVKAAMKVTSKAGLKEPCLVHSTAERMVATMAQLKGIPMAAKRVVL